VLALLKQQSFLVLGRHKTVPGHGRNAVMRHRQFWDCTCAVLLPPVRSQSLSRRFT
jgi:hypothetical protein